MMTIMYPNYEQYVKYDKYHNDDDDDWGFFVNLDDLYDHQLSRNNKYIDNYKKQQKRINYMSPIREIGRNVGIDMGMLRAVDTAQCVEGERLYSLRSDGASRRNMEIEMVDDDEFGWYVPDKRPNKHEQIDIDSTSKRTKININIEYDYDRVCNGVIAQQRERDVVADPEYGTLVEYSDNNAFMKSCLNTCIVLGISIGCSIFIVLF